MNEPQEPGEVWQLKVMAFLQGEEGPPSLEYIQAKDLFPPKELVKEEENLQVRGHSRLMAGGATCPASVPDSQIFRGSAGVVASFSWASEGCCCCWLSYLSVCALLEPFGFTEVETVFLNSR